MTILMAGQAARTGTNRITSHMVLVGAVLVASTAVRFSMLDYNSASVGESGALAVGQRILAGDMVADALPMMHGSYLYPVLAALAANLSQHGLIGARALSALLSTVAAFGVYICAQRLLSSPVAILSMLVYGFTGVSIFAATQATAASLGSACIAISAALLAVGLTTQGTRHRSMWCLLVAGLSFGFAMLTDYATIIWLLPIGVLAITLLVRSNWPLLGPLLGMFGIPVLILLGVYHLLAGMAPGQFFTQLLPATGRVTLDLGLIQRLSSTIRLPFVLALIGLVPVLRGQDDHQRRAVPVLWIAALIAPVVGLISTLGISLEALMAYAMVFLAPLAGFGLITLLRMITHRPGRQNIALAVTAVYVLVALQLWNDYAWGMQRTWPNSNRVVAYLHNLPVAPGTPILAEDGSVYDYYLNWGAKAQLTDTSAHQFGYAGKHGADAITAAVDSHYFRYLILDSFTTPDLSAQLARTALARGYTVTFRDTTQVNGDDARAVTIEVYTRPAR